MTLFSTRGERPRLLTNDDNDDQFASAEMTVVAPADNNSNKMFKNNKKRSTNFLESVSIRTTLHLYDMTGEEINNTWYTEEDMSTIKSTLFDDLRKIQSGKPLRTFTGNDGDGDGGNDFTLRGLEHYVKRMKNSCHSTSSKPNSIYAVLDKQDEQVCSGYNDPEAIREIYSGETTEYTSEARMLGTLDEIEATLIHRGNNNGNNNKKEEETSKNLSENNNNSNNLIIMIDYEEEEDCSICSLEEEVDPSLDK